MTIWRLKNDVYDNTIWVSHGAITKKKENFEVGDIVPGHNTTASIIDENIDKQYYLIGKQYMLDVVSLKKIAALNKASRHISQEIINDLIITITPIEYNNNNIVIIGSPINVKVIWVYNIISIDVELFLPTDVKGGKKSRRKRIKKKRRKSKRREL